MKPSKLRRAMIHREASRLSRSVSSVEMVQRIGALPIQQQTLERQWYYGKTVHKTVTIGGKEYTAPMNELYYRYKPVKPSSVQVCYSDSQERLSKARTTRQANKRNIGV